MIAEWCAIIAEVAAVNEPVLGRLASRTSEALAALEEAPCGRFALSPPVRAGRRQCAARQGSACSTWAGAGDSIHRAHIVTARFHAENLATGAVGLAHTVIEGGGAIQEARDALIT